MEKPIKRARFQVPRAESKHRERLRRGRVQSKIVLSLWLQERRIHANQGGGTDPVATAMDRILGGGRGLVVAIDRWHPLV